MGSLIITISFPRSETNTQWKDKCDYQSNSEDERNAHVDQRHQSRERKIYDIVFSLSSGEILIVTGHRVCIDSIIIFDYIICNIEYKKEKCDCTLGVPSRTDPVDVLFFNRILFVDLVGTINNVWFCCRCFSQNVNKGNSHCTWHKVTNHEECAIFLIGFWGRTTSTWQCFSSGPSIKSVDTLRFSTKFTNKLFRCKCVSEEEVPIIVILNIFFKIYSGV